MRYTTLIQLPATEKIMQAATGDKDFWIIDTQANYCFLHPAKEAIHSDLNLITDKGNVYSFTLDDDENAMPDLKIVIEPSDASSVATAQKRVEVRAGNRGYGRSGTGRSGPGPSPTTDRPVPLRLTSYRNLPACVRETLQCIVDLGPEATIKAHAFTTSGDSGKWKRVRGQRPILDPNAIAKARGISRGCVHRHLWEGRAVLRDVFNADGRLFLTA